MGELKKDVCKCNFPMPDNLSSELQATIRKCLQTDRRKRMTLRQALKDDPWLTSFGTLPCPVSRLPKTVFEDTVVAADTNSSRSDEDTRRQYMKDLERDSHNLSKIKKTVIYHPINPSIYYTTKASQSMTPGQQVQNVELLRSELLQSVRSRARRLGIKSTDRWAPPALKSLFKPFQRPKDARSGNNRSISEIVQRFTKDRTYHFQLMPTHHSPSLSSSSSSISSIDENIAFDKRNCKEVMALLRQTCQLMGITYVQSSPVLLHCILTLRSAPSNKKQATNQRYGSSSAGTSVVIGGNESIHTRNSTSTKRLSLPLISHLTSSMTLSFFARNKARQSLDETMPTQRKKQKEGMAMFTIEIEEGQHKKRHQNRISLRFSKQQGSNTVFKMAGGWVAGVMALDGKIGR